MNREKRFEYAFEGVNGTIKEVYHLHEIPRIQVICDVWNVFPIKYVRESSNLKDKNGKEIFEGDIVKCLLAKEPEDKGFICQFKDYQWKFINVRYPDDDFYDIIDYDYIQKNCEIIGKTFENY
jgi:uncharacterized phage protein (TIGR01671 family)